MDATLSSNRSASQRLGSLVLFAGLALLICCGMEAMSERGLPGMPRAWHANQVLWWILAVTLIVAGSRLLAPHDAEAVHWSPSQPGIRFQKVQVYTRRSCPLCDEALLLLERHQRWLPRIVTVDIDHDPRLRERYGSCVPVVLFDGKVRFKGGVSAPLLRRLIEGTPPR